MFCFDVSLSTPSSNPSLPIIDPPCIFLLCFALTRSRCASYPGVDSTASEDIRSSAQGFIAFVTLGLGMFVGGELNGWWNAKQKLETGMNWEAVWYFPAIMATVVLLAFFFAFQEPSPRKKSA